MGSAFAEIHLFPPEHRMGECEAKLKLTAEQKPKVKAALEQTAKKNKALPNPAKMTPEQKKQRGKQFTEILRAESDTMKGILTPEQFQEYLKLPLSKPGGKA